jgi:hypothetical protein
MLYEMLVLRELIAIGTETVKKSAGITQGAISSPFTAKKLCRYPRFGRTKSIFSAQKTSIIFDFWELQTAEAVVCICDGVPCLACAG